MSLELSLEEYQNIIVITLNGILQPDNANFLQSSLDGLVRDGFSRFVLDCTQLKSINSDGLAVLYDLFLELPPSGKIVLCNANRRIQGILNISGLGHYLVCVESRDTAMKAARNDIGHLDLDWHEGQHPNR
ncbi:MAG: STAS domain-containing protein [Endozoicomonadaceae bacterium]|nr:STAS domain-containing protein [Endozoicomonadaceae bacterium]